MIRTLLRNARHDPWATFWLTARWLLVLSAPVLLYPLRGPSRSARKT